MRSSENVVKSVILATEYSGDGLKNVTGLPNRACTEHFDKHGVFKLICSLDQASVVKNPKDDIFEDFKKLFSLNSQPSQYAAEEAEKIRLTHLREFMENGGIEVLLRLLMTTSLLPAHLAAAEETPHALAMKDRFLGMLCQLCLCDECVAQVLAEREDVFYYLFNFIQHEQTSVKACELIVHILGCRKDPLNLNTVPNFRTFVNNLGERQLADFCSVLAIAISDLDVFDNKSSLYAQNTQKRSKNFVAIRDINQEAILDAPSLLGRLVNFACKKPYIPRLPGGCGEIDHWDQWIDMHLGDEEIELDHLDVDDEVDVVNEAQQDQAIPQVVTELTRRVEVVYVLGLLLIGKLRKRVQKLLAELQLIPQMSELFDEFIWQSHSVRHRNHLLGHNSGCECSPEVPLKIQFLRLIHSFCDHSEYKHLMLTEEEYNELQIVQEKYIASGQANLQHVNDMNHLSRSLMCRGSKGLLTKIVEVMKKESKGSTFRFWLSRAVESYLRGTTYYADQIFLIERGLLQHVASNLVNNDVRQKEIRQSSFDLLGELVKFNGEAFYHFDKVINTDQKFKKLVSIINKNLVDSNMFIRSLILSLEHFLNMEVKPKGYVCTESRLLSYIMDFRHRVTYLHKLLNLIDVHSLTQENVSCLNTTLVLLMFANMKGIMHTYLEALREKSESCTHPDQGANLMQNFRDLLLFWQDHYLHKDKDCTALEKSSRISFEYWKQTVSTLVQEDRTSVLALAHYLPEVSSVRNS